MHSHKPYRIRYLNCDNVPSMMHRGTYTFEIGISKNSGRIKFTVWRIQQISFTVIKKKRLDLYIIIWYDKRILNPVTVLHGFDFVVQVKLQRFHLWLKIGIKFCWNLYFWKDRAQIQIYLINAHFINFWLDSWYFFSSKILFSRKSNSQFWNCVFTGLVLD